MDGNNLVAINVVGNNIEFDYYKGEDVYSCTIRYNANRTMNKSDRSKACLLFKSQGFNIEPAIDLVAKHKKVFKAATLYLNAKGVCIRPTFKPNTKKLYVASSIATSNMWTKIVPLYNQYKDAEVQEGHILYVMMVGNNVHITKELNGKDYHTEVVPLTI